jgi:hypothetical protein
MAGTLTVDTIQSDSSYASRINVTSNVAFSSPVTFNTPANFAGGMQVGGQDATFGGMRNRVINGDMNIDQRAAGANTTITTSGHYTVDRWAASTNVSSKFKVGQNLNSISAPNGFYNYLGVQSLSSYSSSSADYAAIYYSIEGYNLLDLNLGSSSGSPFTISFWVRSSLTGTFTFTVSASYGSNAGYATTYTINSANTWEYKTITIPATSIGTWNRANALGMMLWWDLGTGSAYHGTTNTWSSNYTLKVAGTQNVIGTNGATFYITGVQFEKGSAATAFENRHYQQELAVCQRYFYTTYTQGVAVGSASQPNARTSYAFDASSLTRAWFVNGAFPVPMRTLPTTTIYDQSTGASGYVREYSSAVQRAVSSINNGGQNGDQGMFGYMLLATNGSQIPQQFHLACSAEL